MTEISTINRNLSQAWNRRPLAEAAAKARIVNEQRGALEKNLAAAEKLVRRRETALEDAHERYAVARRALDDFIRDQRGNR